MKTDVAIVGAGPYGFSVAAHLRAAGLDVTVIGAPLGLWRAHMPDGMFLKSEAYASSLSDPRGEHTITAFGSITNRPCSEGNRPIPLDTFIAYGEWFQRLHVPDVELAQVTGIARTSEDFAVTLDDDRQLRARAVVVAVGVQPFAYLPSSLSGVDSTLVSHSCTHTDVGALRRRDVLVVGSGQSALELAALLHEGGATVRVVSRRQRLQWNDVPPPYERSLADRVRRPLAPLYRARTALGPAGAWWLRPRFEGRVPVLHGHTPVSVSASHGGVRVRTETADGQTVDLRAEHVVAATGYRPEVARLPFLDGPVRERIRTTAGAPAVDAGFESTVPGLYFIGPAVASTFGPAMRFVWGADFAARTVARRLTGAIAHLA
jgi:cation diffusion facilitator CzcD-associated flavoprotein CzcO